MAKNEEKTNVMRVLEQKKVPYVPYHIPLDTAVSGEEMARLMNQDPEQVFKTLVTVGKTRNHYVFVIPVGLELDLRKAAKAVGEKSIEMIPQKELLPLTGYIHGGCSPIGMKKFFTTTIDRHAGAFQSIIFSAGKVGFQVEVSLLDLAKVIRYQTADVTADSAGV
ncbi:MAG: Cys-tRNA(Pro) deacylase [Parasporobacterium sp.]|nr:Cys-tRNA(Pro) deacylase [Parasporobacterium sp.]